jgi:hypothetical protein
MIPLDLNFMGVVLSISLLLLVFSPSLVILSHATACVSGDPLNCALNNIIIPIIPSPSYPNSTLCLNDDELCISNFACYGINIDTIPSSYVYPTEIDFGLNNLGTDCNGDYVYKPVIGKKQHGVMDVHLYDTNFVLDLFVGKNGIYPWNTTIKYCNYTSCDIDISFSAGGTLDNLTPVIEKIVKTAVYDLVCTGLVNLIDVNLTNTIQDSIDPQLQAIVAYGPSPVPDFGNSIINWNESLFDLIHNFIGFISSGPIWPCITEQFPQLVNLTRPLINRIVDKATNGTGVIIIDLNGTSTEISNTSSLKLNYVAIGGLDTFNEIYLLEPSPSQPSVLSTNIGLANFTLDFEFTLIINEGNYTYEETLKIAASISNVTIALDLIVAVNKDIRSNQYLYQILNPSCFAKTFEDISISSLILNLDINSLVLSEIQGNAGALEASLVQFVDNFLLMINDGFGDLTTALILGLGQGPIRSNLNAGITATVNELLVNTTCPSSPAADEAPIVWSNSTVIKFVNGILDDMIGPTGLNNLVNCLTDNTGELVITTDRVNITLMGLNTFSTFDILEPVLSNPYALNTHVAIAGPVTINISSLTPSSMLFYNNLDPDSIFSNIVGAALGLQNEEKFGDNLYSTYVLPSVYSELGSELVSVLPPSGWYISLELSNLVLGSSTEIKLNKASFANLTLGEVGTSGCIASTVESFQFTELNLTVSNATMVVRDGSKELPNIIKVIDLVFKLITSDKHLETMNANIADKLSKAELTCENGGVYPEPNTFDDDRSNEAPKWTWELTLLVIGCVLCLVGFIWIGRKYSKEGNNMCSGGIESKETVDGKLKENQSVVDEQKFSWTWSEYKESDALVFKQTIPLWIRILFPLACIVDICIFLQANWFAPNAVWVLTKITFGDIHAEPPPVFKFALENTVNDMWDAKTYTLSILIAFFSGAWPYCKLLVMFWAWMAPLKLLPIAKRESWLTWLDFLGKWSLIDFFVMVMMMCAFYFVLPLGNNLVVNVFVQPNWGFYGFLLATMISLGLGHIVLAFHRLVVQPKIITSGSVAEERESLFQHQYAILYKLDDEKNTATMEDCDYRDFDNHSGVKKRYFQLTNLGGIVIIFMIILTTFFIVAGTFLETFDFEFKGLTGLLLQQTDAADVKYSLVSCGTTVPKASGHPDQFAVRWMEVSFLCFGLGFPLALMVTLIFLWFYPMRLKSQKSLFTLAEVFNAWSALDVFTLSIAAALLEIQQFAAFIVGDSCDGINKILKKYLNQQLDGDDKCFDVIATLTDQCWSIFLAAALMIVFCWPSLAVAHSCVDDRIERQAKKSLLENGIDAYEISGRVKDERLSTQSNASLEVASSINMTLANTWTKRLLFKTMNVFVSAGILKIVGDKYVHAKPEVNSGRTVSVTSNKTSMRPISEDFYSPLNR